MAKKAATTKAKPERTEADYARQDEREAIAADFELFEKMVEEAIAEDRLLSFEEITFAKTKLGIEIEDAGRRQIERLKSIQKFQSRAGSQQDRTKQAKHVDDCKAVLDTRGKELDEQIRALQTEQAKLKQNHRLARQRLEQMEENAMKLREKSPPFVRATYNRRKSHIKSTLGRRAKDLATELQLCRTMVAGNPQSKSFQETLKFHHGKLFQPDQFGRMRLDVAAWELTRQEYGERIHELEKQHAEAERELQTALAETEQILDYYSQ